jgi:excinuclease UvrABC ATPase subunit
MHEYIELRGARENSLKDVTLRIPKRQITIFTGVSGSGKSSIMFDTIATEAQRQLSHARPAAQHALGRRVPLDQARERAAQSRERLRAGRANDGLAYADVGTF